MLQGMDLKVTCGRCDCVLDHVCNSELRREAIDLYKMVLEVDRKTLRKSPEYSENAEKMPFFSETFLYPLLGKDDARSVLARISNLLRAAGLDPGALRNQAWLEILRDKVTLQYVESEDLLKLRLPGKVTSTKEKDGLSLLMSSSEEVLGMTIPGASSLDESLVPDVLWLSDAFAIWKHGTWSEPKHHP